MMSDVCLLRECGAFLTERPLHLGWDAYQGWQLVGRLKDGRTRKDPTVVLLFHGPLPPPGLVAPRLYIYIIYMTIYIYVCVCASYMHAYRYYICCIRLSTVLSASYSNTPILSIRSIVDPFWDNSPAGRRRSQAEDVHGEDGRGSCEEEGKEFLGPKCRRMC